LFGELVVGVDQGFWNELPAELVVEGGGGGWWWREWGGGSGVEVPLRGAQQNTWGHRGHRAYREHKEDNEETRQTMV